MNVILIGVQGSGKGTQAELLSLKTGWKHISTGDIFRNQIEKNTELGKAAKKYMAQGLLVPDEFVLNMVKVGLDETKGGFILDGFPRNTVQCDFLLEHFSISFAFFLQLDDAIARERLLARRLCIVCKSDYNLLFKPPQKNGICDVCGGEIARREDDTEAAINQRIEKFHNEIKNVLQIFQNKGLLKVIDANQPIATIHQEIISQLHN